jgi:hypothetical protein
MLIDYTERAYRLIYEPLCDAEHNELYEVFRRVGEGLSVPHLPPTYTKWQEDRRYHLRLDLVYSEYTALLYQQYRYHLGPWRYYTLLKLQALLAPEEVRVLLALDSPPLFADLLRVSKITDRLRVDRLIRRMLIPARYWEEIKRIERFN